MHVNERDIHDLVGIGFGPSNLAVAIALEESGHPLRSVFFDRKPEFAWHPGLMFAGAEMQVSFTKDLITMRNPRSRFSFLNYLAEQSPDRLAKFINLRTFYPTRVEFNAYYAWAARQFDELVHWGTEVLDVSGVPGADGIELLRVTVRDRADGQTRSVLTRNVLLAPGGTPHVPEDTALGDRVFHASETRERLQASFDDLSAPYHFNIVGSGQTSADVFMHLRRSYPNARITTNIRGFAMRPEDDTHFVNELFLPEFPDWFHRQDSEFRQKIIDDYGLAAHTGVSYDLIPQIYREYYEDLSSGCGALSLHRFTELVGAYSDADRAVATYFHLDSAETSKVEADAVILATGYRYRMPVPALAGLGAHLRMETPERYAIRRDYAIESVEGFAPRIFLQGFAEATHGFSEVLLSLMPVRAAEIVQSLAENTSVESR
ncbi:lysine N(6)-hydroxylase/L-ornithine N(5)-oxygenase family protein [Streptomyces fuscichromogenes]|uniref:lysine N(6)-hydroxylase/L-ornithine N(5)-oxygenase family protein n=1 Tax=Streptomyces fuscichromogenes TaxID=1324013 RepID=UPI00381B4CBF